MKRTKINPNRFGMYTEPVSRIYEALENEIFEQITKTLSEGLFDENIFNWQIEKMNQLNFINNESIKLLSKTTRRAEKEIRKAIKNAGIDTIKGVDEELKGLYDTLEIPSQIEIILESYVNQIFREYNNFINQALIDSNLGQGTISDVYKKIINDTTAKVATGFKTVDEGIVETVNEWMDKGLKTGFVDRGGNRWSLQRYARTTIRTTVNRVYNNMRTSRMEEYGLDLVLVTSLPDPREACSHIQGKVASIKEPILNNSKYPSIYDFGYGEPWGLRGINCRHQFVPFIEGINENNQRQYSQEEMTKNRELRQKQRYYEREVRKAKKELRIAEINRNEEIIRKYRARLRKKQFNIQDFVNRNNLTRQYDREKVIF